MIARHFRRPRLIAFFIAGLISFFDLAGFWKIELLPLLTADDGLIAFFFAGLISIWRVSGQLTSFLFLTAAVGLRARKYPALTAE